MFYEPDKRNHGLKFNPFKALVVPRPIGWISSIDVDGTPNLAPYSMFNAVAGDPPCVMFASSTKASGSSKDSRHCAEATGEFVVNLATYTTREPMNRTSEALPLGISEFETAKLEFVPSILVKPPRVKSSPVQMECKFLQTIEMPRGVTDRNFVTFGRVIGVHIDDGLIVDGRVDICRARPIARMGYMDYAVVDDVFEMIAPSRQGKAFAAAVAQEDHQGTEANPPSATGSIQK
jgi:flavin reductase (DIM6/NTAB) family NADH-FMN oxidoreductase RutF